MSSHRRMLVWAPVHMLRSISRSTNSLIAGLALAFLVFTTIQTAQAQRYTVIHNFTGQRDGAFPFTGVTVDASGTLYGTAFGGGDAGFGTLYSLNPSGSGWIFSRLYSFSGDNEGAGPFAPIVLGPNGAFFGSTAVGGGGPCTTGYRGCGTVFELQPPMTIPAQATSSWNVTTLYRFSGDNGAYPQGELTFDGAGNIYGTTVNGGSAGWGTVYSLTHNSGGWSGNTIYQVQNNGDGQYAWGGVVFDAAGNLYGVFSGGGPYGYGAVFELTPSGSGWSESTIHGFHFSGHDGASPQTGLIADHSGNLYGTTVHDSTGGGTVFQLSSSGGGWSYNFLYGFTGGIDLGPYDSLVMDSAGNLYGTTFGDGRYGAGSVFKLTRSSGGWTYSSLHDFTGGNDGGNPVSTVSFDADGNLYGTASDGGAYGKGVVFKITP